MVDLGLADSGECREIAVACADFLRRSQHPDGYWEYPNREWKGRIATVEGNYATVGMLDTFARTGDERLLEGAKRWYHYMVEHVGFQEKDGTLAVNYFANRPGPRVPNNAASAVRFLGQLAAMAWPGARWSCADLRGTADLARVAVAGVAAGGGFGLLVAGGGGRTGLSPCP